MVVVRLRTKQGVRRVTVPKDGTFGDLRAVIEQECGILKESQVLSNKREWYKSEEEENLSSLSDNTLLTGHIEHGDMLFLDDKNDTHNVDDKNNVGPIVVVKDNTQNEEKERESNLQLDFAPLTFPGLDSGMMERQQKAVTMLLEAKELCNTAMNSSGASSTLRSSLESLSNQIEKASKTLTAGDEGGGMGTGYPMSRPQTALSSSSVDVDGGADEKVDDNWQRPPDTPPDLEKTESMEKLQSKLAKLQAETTKWHTKYTKLRAKAQQMNDAGMQLKRTSEDNEKLFRQQIAQRDQSLRELNEEIFRLQLSRNDSPSSPSARTGRPPSSYRNKRPDSAATHAGSGLSAIRAVRDLRGGSSRPATPMNDRPRTGSARKKDKPKARPPS